MIYDKVLMYHSKEKNTKRLKFYLTKNFLARVKKYSLKSTTKKP